MHTVKLLSWGIVVYALMYLLAAALTTYHLVGASLGKIVTLVALVVVLTIAGYSLRALTWKDILPYSLVWMLEVAALDALLTVPFAGWNMFLSWYVWVGYVLVCTVPLFAVPRVKHSSDIPRI